METVRLTVRVPEALRTALKVAAARQRRTLEGIVVDALRAAVERQGRELV